MSRGGRISVLSVGNMYPPHHLGGYEITWRQAVEHLRERGHQVTVLTTDYRRPEVSQADAGDVHRDLRWYWRDHDFPPLGLRQRLALERHNQAVLDRHLADLRPDVVSWWAMGGMSLGLIESVRARGLPAVGVVGDDWMAYGPRVDAWQRLLRRAGPAAGPLCRATGLPGRPDLSAAATWLFNSARTREAALAGGLDPARAEVLYPGIDHEAFAPAPARPWTGRLACVGRLDPRKGVGTAIEALAALEDATLRVVGGGDEAHRAELEALARRVGVAERVSFHELPSERVAEAYRDADALVFPVRWAEPFGLVPLEAMACGTPVLATGTGGSAEYLAEGRNCLLFEPGDAAALADRVRRLAGDAELRERLRTEGLATAGRFTADGFVEGIEAALETAAAGAPTASAAGGLGERVAGEAAK